MKAMARNGWEVHGYEPNAGYACVLQEQLGFPIYSRPEDLDAAGLCFDFVTFNFSFEHLPDPRRMLCVVRSHQSSGGRLRISVPDPNGLEARLFRSRWFHLDAPRHIALFDKEQLTRLLQDAGYAVQTMDLPVATGFAGSVAYVLTGRFKPSVWYASIPAGILFSLFVRDGLYAADATVAPG
jgi:SAM-dependent methyltransferase